MRVKIVKCSCDDYSWYKGLIGNVFDVIKTINDGKDYYVRHNGFTWPLLCDDCEILN